MKTFVRRFSRTNSCERIEPYDFKLICFSLFSHNLKRSRLVRRNVDNAEIDFTLKERRTHVFSVYIRFSESHSRTFEK